MPKYSEKELQEIIKKTHIKQLRQAVYDCYKQIEVYKNKIKEVQNA